MRARILPLILSVLAAACAAPQLVTPTQLPRPTQTPGQTPSITATADLPTISPAFLPPEAILILQPAPGSRLTSPAVVAGEADPTFEQTLVVRLLLADGTELNLLPTQIQADLGLRGSFEAQIPFSVENTVQGFIQVYDTSARDGGILHLSSVGVSLAANGPEEVLRAAPHPERIVIFQPEPNTTISGGTAHVEGFALASFEQTLIVEVLDVEGTVMGSRAVVVEAPELGQPGPFTADVAYELSQPGPGRIVVRDPSPAFAGDVHLNSVEVRLAP